MLVFTVGIREGDKFRAFGAVWTVEYAKHAESGNVDLYAVSPIGDIQMIISPDAKLEVL